MNPVHQYIFEEKYNPFSKYKNNYKTVWTSECRFYKDASLLLSHHNVKPTSKTINVSYSTPKLKLSNFIMASRHQQTKNDMIVIASFRGDHELGRILAKKSSPIRAKVASRVKKSAPNKAYFRLGRNLAYFFNRLLASQCFAKNLPGPSRIESDRGTKNLAQNLSIFGRGRTQLDHL